jgi:hypothetical protein
VSEVQRYEVNAYREAGEGEWVRYTDHARRVAELEAEVALLTHKCITCGVAASHPNPDLTRTGAYAGKWDSPQAEAVRKLRQRCEAAEADAGRLRADATEAVEGLIALLKTAAVFGDFDGVNHNGRPVAEVISELLAAESIAELRAALAAGVGGGENYGCLKCGELWNGGPTDHECKEGK